ncbi:MAG: hypothetical protein KAR40_16875 [Candidatus Sabulitectum sp.]|nr:hypothetical protein [Candidatus Sabulitectum sp.]
MISCSNNETCDFIVTGYIHPEWTTIARFNNGMQLGCRRGDIPFFSYGRPTNISADSSGIVFMLYRIGIEDGPGLAEYDWDGNPVWCVNNGSNMGGISAICLKDTTVVACATDSDMRRIKIYDRRTGEILDTHEMELSFSYDEGFFYDFKCLGNTYIGTLLFNENAIVFLDEDFEENTALTNNSCLTASDSELHALACSNGRIYAGTIRDESLVHVFDSEGTLLESFSFGYKRKKPILLMSENVPLLAVMPVDDLQSQNDSLWVLLGTAVFPTDSSEIWIVDLNTREASVIPFSSAVTSFAVFDGRLVIAKTNIHLSDDFSKNTLIDRETELCTARYY